MKLRGRYFALWKRLDPQRTPLNHELGANDVIRDVKIPISKITSTSSNSNFR